jgi:hypothetical protein
LQGKSWFKPVGFGVVPYIFRLPILHLQGVVFFNVFSTLPSLAQRHFCLQSCDDHLCVKNYLWQFDPKYGSDHFEQEYKLMPTHGLIFALASLIV